MISSAITRITIGIQARSTSVRFPKKVFADLCGKPVLQWVIDAAKSSARYMNRPYMPTSVEVCLLIPHKDEIRDVFHKQVHIIEGDEDDVLSRYKSCLDFYNTDYVVRITGDCPLISAEVISNCINTAVKNKYDYLSNVDPECRTAFDGEDVEIISADLLRYIDKHAREKYDREHVTPFVRNTILPEEFTINAIVGSVDKSKIKLSLDTPEDLERIKREAINLMEKEANARKKNGNKTPHRFS
jgi:spore coat polysaccharide biosynthesis protein SpsF